MCQKRGYANQAEARQSLKVLRFRKMRKDRALNVYRCRECAGRPYHIGHRAA